MLAVALVVPMFSGCDGAKRSVDCGKSALKIAGDVQDVMDAVSNVGNLVDSERRKQTSESFGKLQRDIEDVARNSHNIDQRKTANDVALVAQRIKDAVNKGDSPDVRPLGDAAAELSKACTSS
ncbi:hypothetical protein ACQ4WX_02515 [Streptomyces lasalocidi]